MADLITIPILGPSQESRSFKVNSQRTTNLIPSIEKPGAKSQIVLYPTEGLTLVDEPGPGPTRSNGTLWQGQQWFVVGTDLVGITSGGVVTAYSGITTSGSRCVIARGRTKLAIVDGTNIYSFDGSSITVVSDSDRPAAPTHITYLDGYFIANDDGTDDYYISAIDDPTSWGALDFNEALALPDDITALIATTKDLYLFGPSGTEVHFNSNNPDFPFEPYPGGVIEVGIAAPHSLVKSVYGLIMLGGNDEGDTVVVRINGFQATPISDDDMNYQINSLSRTDDAIGSIYRRFGRTFYVLTFPAADKTFVFDIGKELAFHRKSWDLGRWRGAGIGHIAGATFVGDFENGRIYQFSDAVYDENGDTIERERITQMQHVDGKSFTTHKLILDVEAGVGLTTGQGEDPQMMMQYSDDGGKTWSSELWRSMGRIGEYRHRVEWDGLGESTGRIYKFRVTDPVKTVIIAGYAEVSVSNN